VSEAKIKTRNRATRQKIKILAFFSLRFSQIYRFVIEQQNGHFFKSSSAALLKISDISLKNIFLKKKQLNWISVFLVEIVDLALYLIQAQIGKR
jgi:hypothetical protein